MTLRSEREPWGRLGGALALLLACTLLAACQGVTHAPDRDVPQESLKGLDEVCETDGDCGRAESCLEYHSIHGSRRRCVILCNPLAADKGQSQCPSPLSCVQLSVTEPFTCGHELNLEELDALMRER